MSRRTTWPPADETLHNFALVAGWGAAKASLHAGRVHESKTTQALRVQTSCLALSSPQCSSNS